MAFRATLGKEGEVEVNVAPRLLATAAPKLMVSYAT